MALSAQNNPRRVIPRCHGATPPPDSAAVCAGASSPQARSYTVHTQGPPYCLAVIPAGAGLHPPHGAVKDAFWRHPRRHGATPEAQPLIQDWAAPSPQGATPVLSGRNTTSSRPSRRHGATPFGVRGATAARCHPRRHGAIPEVINMTAAQDCPPRAGGATPLNQGPNLNNFWSSPQARGYTVAHRCHKHSAVVISAGTGYTLQSGEQLLAEAVIPAGTGLHRCSVSS